MREEGLRPAFLRGLEAVLYVPSCAVCDQAVRPPLLSPSVCRDCLSVLPFRVGREILDWEGSFPVYASFFYRDPLPRIISSMKFAGRPDQSRIFGPLMAGTVLRHKLMADAVIPVPLYRKREALRGYNQAGLIASSLAENLGLPQLPSLLVRQRDTERQSEAPTVRERKLQLKGAFSLGEEREAQKALSGRPVLLVDDVLTSGATMMEAARPLLEAGIRVTGLVAASGKNRYAGYKDALTAWHDA